MPLREGEAWTGKLGFHLVPRGSYPLSWDTLILTHASARRQSKRLPLSLHGGWQTGVAFSGWAEFELLWGEGQQV